MVTSGISGEMTFKRKPEEETYSASRGKSSPHSWTSWVPRWEGLRLLRPGRGGSRDGSRAIPGKCDEMWLGEEGRSHITWALWATGRSLDFILHAPGASPGGVKSHLSQQQCGGQAVQEQSAGDTNYETPPGVNVWVSHGLYGCESSQIIVDVIRITLHTLW